MVRYYSLLLIIWLSACQSNDQNQTSDIAKHFPSELVEFKAYDQNPIFAGTGADSWDKHIRERGYILKEGEEWHLWYTGYPDGKNPAMSLGYANSKDGLTWTRHPSNPIFDQSWTEDMMVVKEGGTYYMFAEGYQDIAHLLTSSDRINWQDHGSLKIQKKNGEILEGPYGTPTAWKEDGSWYLLYERNDQGIWLATSSDLQSWTNLQDEPVIKMGPETYDQYGLAVNQVIKQDGRYYAWYHGTAFEDWHEWTTNVAISEDLIHWTKFPGNPILRENKSSGILVHDGDRYLLYSMHDEVHLHYPATDSGRP